MAVNDTKAPTISGEEIAVWAEKHFAVKAGKITPLDSYIDQNFLLTDGDGVRYVAKIANQAESKSYLEAQNKAMLLLNEHGLAVPRPLKNVAGGSITTIAHEDGACYQFRLLTFLPGLFLGDLRPCPEERWQQVGSLMARLDKALANFTHPGIHQILPWDLQHASLVQPLVDHIKDHATRHMVTYFLDIYTQEVLPKLPFLRHGAIHGDANEYNLLCNDADPHTINLIDFGDMVYSCWVFEAAIAAAYAAITGKEPLASAAAVLKGYHEENPLTDVEMAVFFPAMTARLCVSICMAAKRLSLEPGNTYLEVSAKPAIQVLKKLVGQDVVRMENYFRKALTMPMRPQPGRAPQTIINLRKDTLGPSLSLSYRKPLKIVRGFLQHLYDEEGNEYLDCVNNVCHVGHCHPKVAQVAGLQLKTLNTNTRYLHDHLVEYATRLTQTLPDPLKVCFFVCSGSEANELALRMARHFTGRSQVVVIDGAYHGNTGGLVNISPYKFKGKGGDGKGSQVQVAPMPDLYRGPWRKDEPNSGLRYADEVRKALARSAAEGGAAAFMHESILSCGGQIVLPDGYLSAAYTHARNAGALCIADEVQVGFGRAGSHFWAFQTQEVIPDIITMGKPIGNGFPMAAVVTTEQVAHAFANGMEYFNTFGGNPVACAVGLSVLDVIQDEQLQQRADRVGRHLIQGLQRLKQRHPLIGDVRGLGLFLGIEFVRDHHRLEPAAQEASFIVEAMRDRGILLSTDGPLNNVIKIKPPLAFGDSDADRLLSELDATLVELSAHGGIS